MKTLRYWLFGAAMLLFGAGCTETFTDYTPGTPDDENNYGVYFPRQTTNTSLELESSSSTDVTYKVRRTRTDDAITVPVRVEAWIVENDEDNKKTENIDITDQRIFVVSPIRFAEGQRDTEFTIQFPRAELGVQYKVTVTIDDPLYVATYSGNDTALTMSVVRANWTHLGKGKWRDDIFSSIYVNVPNAYAEFDVDIYEREDQPGLYRMQVFNRNYIYTLFNGIPISSNETLSTTINATDPDKVWIPRQSTEISLSDEQGYIVIASNVDKIFSMDASESQYGTLDENGVITFPIHGVLAQLTKIHSEGEWISTNTSGKFRIMLPGARLYDYSITLTRNDGTDGKVGVNFTTGQDVTSVKYALLEGRLDEGQVSLTAQSLDAGEIDFDGEVSPSAGRLSVKPAATGLYTLVCCSYGNGQMQDYAFETFGYIADGDDMPVKLSFGLEQTNEQAGQGFDKSNSIKFYAYGEDIYSLRYALRRNDKTSDQLSDEEIVDRYGINMSSANLALLNNGTYSTLFTGLNGDREYTLYIKADNGYNSEIFKEQFKTEGRYNPLIDGWSYNDFREVNPSLYKKTVLETKYNLYGFDLLDAGGRMKKLGEVEIFDEDDGMGYDDLINIRGIMSSLMIDDGRGEDEFHHRNLIPATETMLRGGYDLYSTLSSPKYGLFAIGSTAFEYQNNGTHYAENIYMIYYAEETLAGYMGNTAYGPLYGMTAGLVDDGCLAITPSLGYAGQGMTCRFMGFVGQKSTFALYLNLMLIDQAVDQGLPKVPPTINEVLNQTYESEEKNTTSPWSAPKNYVEYDAVNIAPYIDRIMASMQAHDRNVFLYPSVPATPGAVRKAAGEITVGGAEGANGEQPAQQMTLKATPTIIRK